VSSPRERGSSGDIAPPQRSGRVVPARAGVIRWLRTLADDVVGRPRASGGHPRTCSTTGPRTESSPRERGSSHAPHHCRRQRHVVPARAGVIQDLRSRHRRARGRPRASGGHPDPEAVAFAIMASSPRERGSSAVQPRGRSGRAVVPARAGVIRAPCSSSRWQRGRPRASGGHPRRRDARDGRSGSSPRERGSSLGRDLPRGRHAVVPARAGVIPDRLLLDARSPRRPRASGGHPAGDMRGLADLLSSPRERGSSPTSVTPSARASVVPARAGVIRSPGSWPPRPACRPRASGGHPRAYTSRLT